MYKQRLHKIIWTMENNQNYKDLALLPSAKNNKAYPSLTHFFGQPGVNERVYKDLSQQWDFAESRFFRNLTEDQKSMLYIIFLYTTYQKFHKEPGLDLLGFWDKKYEKICALRELNPFMDVSDLTESLSLFNIIEF